MFDGATLCIFFLSLHNFIGKSWRTRITSSLAMKHIGKFLFVRVYGFAFPLTVLQCSGSL